MQAGGGGGCHQPAPAGPDAHVTGALDTDRNALLELPVSESWCWHFSTRTAAARGWTRKQTLRHAESSKRQALPWLQSRQCPRGSQLPEGQTPLHSHRQRQPHWQGPPVRTLSLQTAVGRLADQHAHTLKKAFLNVQGQRHRTAREGWLPHSHPHPAPVTGCPGPPRRQGPPLACHPGPSLRTRWWSDTGGAVHLTCIQSDRNKGLTSPAQQAFQEERAQVPPAHRSLQAALSSGSARAQARPAPPSLSPGRKLQKQDLCPG